VTRQLAPATFVPDAHRVPLCAAPLEQKGGTPLHMAVMKGAVNSARVLIAAGAKLEPEYEVSTNVVARRGLESRSALRNFSSFVAVVYAAHFSFVLRLFRGTGIEESCV
jgi:hypothetical protein